MLAAMSFNNHSRKPEADQVQDENKVLSLPQRSKCRRRLVLSPRAPRSLANSVTATVRVRFERSTPSCKMRFPPPPGPAEKAREIKWRVACGRLCAGSPD